MSFWGPEPPPGYYDPEEYCGVDDAPLSALLREFEFRATGWEAGKHELEVLRAMRQGLKGMGVREVGPLTDGEIQAFRRQAEEIELDYAGDSSCG